MYSSSDYQICPVKLPIPTRELWLSSWQVAISLQSLLMRESWSGRIFVWPRTSPTGYFTRSRIVLRFSNWCMTYTRRVLWIRTRTQWKCWLILIRWLQLGSGLEVHTEQSASAPVRKFGPRNFLELSNLTPPTRRIRLETTLNTCPFSFRGNSPSTHSPQPHQKHHRH